MIMMHERVPTGPCRFQGPGEHVMWSAATGALYMHTDAPRTSYSSMYICHNTAGTCMPRPICYAHTAGIPA